MFLFSQRIREMSTNYDEQYVLNNEFDIVLMSSSLKVHMWI